MRGHLAALLVLLLAAPAWAQEPAPPTPEPPVPSQEVLQLRADVERLTLAVEHLSRELARAQGLIDVLLRPTTERLQQRRQQLVDDVARAGYVLDEQGRVVTPSTTDTEQAPETPDASQEP